MTDTYKIKVIKADTGEVVKTLEADTERKAAFEKWLAPTWSRATVSDAEGDIIYVEDWVQGAWVAFCEFRGKAPAQQPAPSAAPAAAAGLSETPKDWRDQFTNAVYADLAAADNQDVPLEEYPARILKVLDSIVGPRHPTVIKWRNDAIEACIEIAHRYGNASAYSERDMRALLAAAPATQAKAQEGH